MKKSPLLLRLLPFLYIFFIWFVFSVPYFFQQKVPYPSNYQVNFFHPWSDYKEFNGPYKNGAMPDVIDQIMPWKHFTVETYKKGQIPFWNPNSFSGTPHLADIQSAVFSPFNLLFFILPFIDAWSIMILLQPLLAGLFTYLLLRELKISPLGSVLSAVTFMFSGFIVVWMAYGTLAMAVLFLPLALYALEKSFQNRSFLSLLLLAVSIPLSFFSGHFQISLYFLFYVSAYYLFKLFATKNKRAGVVTALCIVVGVLIALIQIIPALQLYENAARSDIFSNNGAIPIQYLFTIFSPDFYGNPVTRNDWFGYYAEWSSFVGIVPLVLAFFGISRLFAKENHSNKKQKDTSAQPGENNTIAFFSIAAFVALLLAIDTPLQHLLVQLKLPIFSTSIPSRIITLCSFSLVVLAGFGVDAVRKCIDHHMIKKVVLVLLVPLVLIGVGGIVAVLLPPDKMHLALKNTILPLGLFVAVSGLLLFACRNKKKEFGTVIFICVLLLASFDSYRFAAKWMPFDPRVNVFPEVPVITAMKKYIGTGRVWGNFGAFIDTYYDLPSLEGYDPLSVGRYAEFINQSATGKYAGAGRSVVTLEKRGKYVDRVLDLLGVSLIFHPIPDTYQNWAFPVWADKQRFTQIYSDGKFELFRNNTALSRAKLFYTYEVIPDSRKLLDRFYQQNFDFRNVLLLESNPQIPMCHSDTNSSCQGTAEITAYTPDKVTISVSTNEPALLFLSDTYYPVWKVTVNGKEEQIYRGDYAFRSVIVPKGKSTVTFYYSGLL